MSSALSRRGFLGRLVERGSAADVTTAPATEAARRLVRAARLGTDRFRHSDPTEQELARR